MKSVNVIRVNVTEKKLTMKLTIRYIVIHTAILVALLFPGGTYGSKKEPTNFTGTFPTQTVRLLWMGCFQGANMKNPTNAEANGLICDCILDKVRKRMTHEYVRRNSGQHMQDQYTALANECANEFQQLTLKEAI